MKRKYTLGGYIDDQLNGRRNCRDDRDSSFASRYVGRYEYREPL